MSIFAVKYLPQYGWCAAKNFDFGFKPRLILRKSFRWNTERLYIWDNLSQYSEGINEHKIGVFSSNITLPNDKIQGRSEATDEQKSKAKIKKYRSLNGLVIRKALSENSVEKTVNKLIDLQVTGCTVVFDVNTCIILESGYIKDDDSSLEKYVYETKYVNQNDIVVRGGYGVLLPWIGYSNIIDSEKHIRLQYEKKIEAVYSNLYLAGSPMEVLKSISSNKVLERIEGTKFRTAFQILIKPSETCIHARLIDGSLSANINRLNCLKGKTVFEISSFQNLSFSEHNTMKHKNMINT